MLEDAVIQHSKYPKCIDYYTELEINHILSQIVDELSETKLCINIIMEECKNVSELSIEDAYKVITLRRHINNLVSWFSEAEPYNIMNELLYNSDY